MRTGPAPRATRDSGPGAGAARRQHPSRTGRTGRLPARWAWQQFSCFPHGEVPAPGLPGDSGRGTWNMALALGERRDTVGPGTRAPDGPGLRAGHTSTGRHAAGTDADTPLDGSLPCVSPARNIPSAADADPGGGAGRGHSVRRRPGAAPAAHRLGAGDRAGGRQPRPRGRPQRLRPPAPGGVPARRPRPGAACLGAPHPEPTPRPVGPVAVGTTSYWPRGGTRIRAARGRGGPGREAPSGPGGTGRILPRRVGMPPHKTRGPADPGAQGQLRAEPGRADRLPAWRKATGPPGPDRIRHCAL